MNARYPLTGVILVLSACLVPVASLNARQLTPPDTDDFGIEQAFGTGFVGVQPILLSEIGWTESTQDLNIYIPGQGWRTDIVTFDNGQLSMHWFGEVSAMPTVGINTPAWCPAPVPLPPSLLLLASGIAMTLTWGTLVRQRNDNFH
jgi:hypothetical protein